MKYIDEGKRNEIIKERMNHFNKIDENVTHILIPCCHDMHHWTLLIVDINNKELVVLDSFNEKGKHDKVFPYLSKGLLNISIWIIMSF